MSRRDRHEQWWAQDGGDARAEDGVQEPIVLGWGELTPDTLPFALRALQELREARRTTPQTLVSWEHHLQAARFYQAAIGQPLEADDTTKGVGPEAYTRYQRGLMDQFQFHGDELDAMIDDLTLQCQALEREQTP